MKNKQNAIALKTMAIKAKVANFIRKELYQKRLENFSEKEKIELFNQIFKLNYKMHWDLNNYKTKRKYKNYIQSLREGRKLEK